MRVFIVVAVLSVLVGGASFISYFNTNEQTESTPSLDAAVVNATTTEASERAVASLTFSNTQEWDTTVYDLSGLTPHLVPDAFAHIELPPPPTNTSTATAEELRIMHEMVAEHTPEKIAEIETEVELENVYFGEVLYGDLLKADTFPAVSEFLNLAYYDITVATVHYKQLFDRVRPSVLDDTLTTTIAIPGHPAYPSGHATQSMFIALLLSDIEPDGREEYVNTAKRVARNREVAGVHYPSDSSVGQSLARQYHALLRETSWYQEHLKRAQVEWTQLKMMPVSE